MSSKSARNAQIVAEILGDTPAEDSGMLDAITEANLRGRRPFSGQIGAGQAPLRFHVGSGDPETTGKTIEGAGR